VVIPHAVHFVARPQRDQDGMLLDVRRPRTMRRRRSPADQLPPRPLALPTPATGLWQTELNRTTSAHLDLTAVVGPHRTKLRGPPPAQPGPRSLPYRDDGLYAGSALRAPSGQNRRELD